MQESLVITVALIQLVTELMRTWRETMQWPVRPNCM